MKRILAALLLAFCGMALHAQATFTPSAMTAMCFSSTLAKWVPVAALASGTAATYTPQSVALYGNNGASYYPLQCDASGNLNLSNGGILGQFGNTTAQSPSAGTTFFVPVTGQTNTSAGVARWIAPRACTITAVNYGRIVFGTADTAADNFTLKVYNATIAAPYADTSGTLTAQSGYASVNTITTSDAVAKNDTLAIQIVAPASFTVSPTNIYWTATIICQ